MARGTTADERREAVTYIAAGDLPPPDDIDAAFEDWRKAFDAGDEPGKLTAYQIPLDERGNPIATAKNQIRLGSWPIDLYEFDELCAMLIRDFMGPEKLLAVRLLGSRKGTAGLQFNKVVILRAPKFNPADTNAGEPARESLASLMKTIQEANERTLALVQSMRPPAQPDNSVEKLISMSQAMNAPLIALMTALASGGRIGGGGDGGLGNLSAVVDLATKIADLRGGGEGGNDSTGNDIVDAIRAIVPIAKPALEAIPSIMAARGAMPPAGGVPALTGPVRAAPPPVVPGAAAPRPVAPPRPPPPGSMPTQPPPAAVGVNPTPQMGDIPSGDQEMLAQLMPQIDALVTMAERGSPAGPAADLIFDQFILELPETPDDVLYERVAKLLRAPALISQIAVFNPKVLEHEGWFRQVQAQLIKRYDDEEKAAAAETPSG